MPTPTIEKIRHLKGVGIFSDLSVGQCPHDLKRFNLIYGFNGCGKTTLSRLLESISENGLNSNITDDAEFSFTLSDGSAPSNQALVNAASRFIAVFNEDYIERSLTWKVGAARPIVYLGEEQAELAIRLAELERNETALVSNEVLKAAEWSGAQRTLETHCRDAARLIAEELSLGRRYNATNIKTDYDDETLSTSDKIADDERKRLKEIINRSDLPAKLPFEAVINGGDSLQQSVANALAVQVADIAIDALQRRKDALSWVDEGLHIHAEETECLFCGNDLSERRKIALREALQTGFEELKKQLDIFSGQVRVFRDECRKTEDRVATTPECLPNFRPEFEAIGSKLGGTLSDAQKLAEHWLTLLVEKRASPDRSLSARMSLEINWDKSIEEIIGELNGVIERNNAAIDNFAAEQDAARNKLKRHYLADGRSTFQNCTSAEATSKTVLESVQSDLGSLRDEIGEIRATLKKHGPAATRLNDLLKSYLGHDRIYLQAVDDGYRICRNGEPSNKPLSEGEKTAVAFCYFLTALNSEGRKVKDLIIVLDDPISSLDARSMTHVVSMIRRNFSDPAQLFVLTHNLDFMREMKKWLNKKRDDGFAEFLFIETGIGRNGERSSTLVSMPRLIRDYESEYHYLYSLVKGLAEDPNGFEKFAYLMPNALRKVLDIFLAFKDPGASGLEPKVDKVIADNPSLDGSRIKAMERLAQLESHSESIGDVTTFSAYTLEQVADAARCLLELIQTVDPQHYHAMERLCRA